MTDHAARVAFRIRPATVDDLADVMEVELASFTDPWSEQAYRDSLESDRAVMHVAVDPAGRIVGHSVTYFAADEAELATIAVAASVRRSGIGRGLLDQSVAECRVRGSRKLFLEVRASNTGAQAMYAAAGFAAVGRRRAYYNLPTEDAVLMMREIRVGDPMGAAGGPSAAS
jgi:ribosomal-protein-alanine N-acetyltransferase